MPWANKRQPEVGDGYEKRDVSIRGLLLFGLGLAVLMVLTFFAMKWTFDLLSAQSPLGQPAAPFQTARVVPPSPRLQAQPHIDLQTYCEQQLSVLNSYGWVDQQNGVVRIPIDRAMNILLKQGFPARPENEMSPYDKQAIAPVGNVNALPAEGVAGQCKFVEEHPPSGYAK
jgi:hypothetical protein